MNGKDRFKKLSKDELIDLICQYDEYIQEANDEDKYKTGWKPVCIFEFYDNDFDN